MRKPGKYARRLVIMVKEPRPGWVKTRLGADIGLVQAAWWFRHQSQALIRSLSRDPRWQTSLAVAPDAEGLASRVWPQRVAKRAQGGGDLGARMGALFTSLPPGPVVIIGADIPNITPAHIATAFAALGDHDAVFGPAVDGGYWLIGLRRSTRPTQLRFEGVRWSTKHALADSVACLAGAKVAFVDTLRDVDRATDLEQRSPIQRGENPPPRFAHDDPDVAC